jgi:hypothetical protein
MTVIVSPSWTLTTDAVNEEENLGGGFGSFEKQSEVDRRRGEELLPPAKKKKAEPSQE